METAAKPDHKNLVICCDGTGNETSQNISNVLKLHRCLRQPDKMQPRQMVPYVSAAGTAAPPVNTPRAR
ncbi:phospholipase effector Tle1 domain-containing protein [Bradyrhizobium sp. NC92]|uniref:phospholipase effector Tle1 domain-containing protein n=1 Tax=Bradyrhizobium sp. (strain NC92) TaxID=55395 RepID=UPI003906B84A